VTLLRFVPEPWLSLGLIAALFVAYLYGNVTGTGTERLKQEHAKLQETNAALVRQRDASLEIQTKMAQSMSSLRLQQQDRAKVTDAVIAEIEKGPSTGACVLDDARRLRLQSIRIGPSRTNPRP
jgi:hypothetical protein